jgi:hypothetical protein
LPPISKNGKNAGVVTVAVGKNKQLLLRFLRTGSAEEGGLKKSQEVANSKKEKEWFEWVPWKQIQDWYGPDEALERVEAGLIAVKRIGKNYSIFSW